MIYKQASLVWLAIALATLVGCGSSSPSGSTNQPFPSSHLAFVALPTSNAVASFHINNTTAVFTTVLGSPYPGGTSPAAVLVHPSNKFVYAANQIGNDISLFNIDSTLGSLLEVLPRTPTGLSPISLAMDSGGAFLFAANRLSNNISAYSIDSGSGALKAVAGSPFSTFFNPDAIALTPSAKFLYVLNSNLGAVFAYTNTSGVLKPVAALPVLVGNVPLGITIDPAETFVYVTNSADNTVSVLSINSGTGALTLLGTYATETTPTAAAVQGQYLYVANSGSSNISEFTVAPTTGVLTQLTGSPVSAGTAPFFEIIDPNGLFLYTGSQTAKSISAFTIDTTTGVLTSAAESVPTDVPPVSMSVSK
jgi:6-phosphogluconolactonase